MNTPEDARQEEEFQRLSKEFTELMKKRPTETPRPQLLQVVPDLVQVVERLLREDATGDYSVGLIEDARNTIKKYQSLL